MPPEGNMQIQDNSVGPDNLVCQQSGYAAEKLRSQFKSYVGHKAEEMYVYRSLPLGQDRRRNRYWRFITSVSWNDPGCGRIFVELCDGRWRLIDSEEGFDALLVSLDVRGVRESHLHSMLQMIEMSFKETVRRNMWHVNTERQNQETIKTEPTVMASRPDHSVGADSPSSTVCVNDSDVSETSLSFSIEIGRNEVEKNDALKRYQDYEKWMWSECVNASILCTTKCEKKRCKQVLGVCDYCHDIYFFEDNHCPSCHRTFDTSKRNLNFSEHVAQSEGKLKMDPTCTSYVSESSPMRIRLLKVLLAMVEVYIPSEALQPSWTNSRRESWGMKLHSSLSAEDLIQILTQLENAIKRDYLSNFETTSELLDLSNPSTCTANYSSSPEMISVLPWVPQTTAAVALRLMDLDGSISNPLHQKVESQKDKADQHLIKLPAKYAVVKKNTRDEEMVETPCHVNYLQEANWVDVGFGLAGPSCGRGNRGSGRGRTHSGRSRGRIAGSRSESGKRSTSTNGARLEQLLVWKGQPRGRGGHKRGRRSARSRQKSTKKVVGEKDNRKESIFEKSRNFARDKWIGDEINRLQVVGAETASSSGRSEYEDENGQATGDEYDDILLAEYAVGFNGRSNDLQEESDDNVDGDEDEDEGDDGVEEVDLDIEGYINEDSDEEEGIRDGNGNRNADPDEGTGSSSSEYSD